MQQAAHPYTRRLLSSIPVQDPRLRRKDREKEYRE
ncbi:hypothetical protein ACFTAO_37635 [Paenibacillus rhizoplanae]